jgi:hypothetical protein
VVSQPVHWFHRERLGLVRLQDPYLLCLFWGMTNPQKAYSHAPSETTFEQFSVLGPGACSLEFHSGVKYRICHPIAA